MIEINKATDLQALLHGGNVPAPTEAAQGFTVAVRYLRASTSGDTVCIGIELADKTRNLSESRRYTVHTTLLPSLGLRRGIISREKLGEIEQTATLSAAWQKGLSILAYGANSAQALSLKLRQRGFDAETAARAVELIRSQGYLHEDSDAAREAERSLSKGWGLRRIEQHLRQRGYDAEAVAAALETLSDEDFDERCRRVARKYCPAPPEDAKQKQKVIAYLLRYGYDMSEIRHALETAWEED